MIARAARDRDLRRPSGAGHRSSRDPRELFERHGAALFALALTLSRDRDRAEMLAADAILDACTGPVHVSQGADRWELARYVYVRSRRAVAEQSDCGPSAAEVAVALGVFGGHTYQEIADLMRLTPLAVAQLLRTGLASPRSV